MQEKLPLASKMQKDKIEIIQEDSLYGIWSNQRKR